MINRCKIISSSNGTEQIICEKSITPPISNSIEDIKMNLVGNTIENLNSVPKVFIKYNKENNKFKFKTNIGKLIGSFSANDVILYLLSYYDDQGKISSLNNTTIQLINEYVCSIKYNNKINTSKVILLNYDQSGFMGDIELLIIFNKDLDNYYKTKLQDNLSLIDLNNRDEAKNTIDNFIIKIMHYTIKLISNIKKTGINEQLRTELLYYSIGITYKITSLVNSKLLNLEEKQNNLYDLLKKSMILKKNIDDKIVIISENNSKLEGDIEIYNKEENNKIEEDNYNNKIEEDNYNNKIEEDNYNNKDNNLDNNINNNSFNNNFNDNINNNNLTSSSNEEHSYINEFRIVNNKLDLEKQLDNQQVNKLNNQQFNKFNNQQVNKLNNQQVNKFNNQQVNKLNNQQVNKFNNQQVNKLNNQQVNKLNNQQVNKKNNFMTSDLDEEIENIFN